MTGEYDSMYERSQANIIGLVSSKIKAKMSYSERMIFETRQLKKANSMILSQPDRLMHDYG